jgi:hypothetical protein
MITYYVICYEKIEKCYLIREGYIPCRDYRKNYNDLYYAAYSRDLFCLPIDDKKNVFENLIEAKQECIRRINEKFKDKLITLIEDRNLDLKYIEEIK